MTESHGRRIFHFNQGLDLSGYFVLSSRAQLILCECLLLA